MINITEEKRFGGDSVKQRKIRIPRVTSIGIRNSTALSRNITQTAISGGGGSLIHCKSSLWCTMFNFTGCFQTELVTCSV